jgi:hypothetical protein
MVCSAIRRARHGAREPSWTRAQIFGNRCASSRAWRPGPAPRPRADPGQWRTRRSRTARPAGSLRRRSGCRCPDPSASTLTTGWQRRRGRRPHAGVPTPERRSAPGSRRHSPAAGHPVRQQESLLRRGSGCPSSWSESRGGHRQNWQRFALQGWEFENFSKNFPSQNPEVSRRSLRDHLNHRRTN